MGRRQSALENVEVMTLFGSAYDGKRVLVTGHTGFKGAWLCEWLLGLGAEVTGLSLPPPTEPSLFAELGLAKRLRHILGDIQDTEALRELIKETKPDFVFHLAAQPLVRESYSRPRETFAVNAMGALNLLEALRDSTQIVRGHFHHDRQMLRKPRMASRLSRNRRFGRT